jgi:hypothetical protein
VRENSTFQVVCANILEESKYSYYSEQNKKFTEKEKQQLHELNAKLGESPFFAMGLLLAFFYTTPDNTMPLIWNDGCVYTDEKGVQRNWSALFARKTTKI